MTTKTQRTQADTIASYAGALPNHLAAKLTDANRSGIELAKMIRLGEIQTLTIRGSRLLADTDHAVKTAWAKHREAVKTTQNAQDVHYENATTDNYDDDAYRASLATLMYAIKTTYPDVDAERVREVQLDCGESIAWCVGLVRRDMVAEAEAAAEVAREQAEYAAAQSAAHDN